MLRNVATYEPAGPYLVGYATGAAEGVYAWSMGEFVWREPNEENLHIAIAVRDSADGRFVPGLRVTATLITPEGRELGTHEHYGHNWKVPGDGSYTLRVQIAPPQFMRHDEINGKRFTEPIGVEFRDVQVTTGRDDAAQAVAST